MPPIKLAIVGVGKIVRDQHLPSIAADPDFELAATASRHGTVDGVTAYKSIEEMLAAQPEIEAVSLCMPPQFRYDAALTALNAGKHVFLEKPPGATISEVEDLKRIADARGVSLFASWHSRYAPAVESAKAFLAASPLKSLLISWKEDVRHWHPNQDWIWQPGGLGVFDPGINALSILTAIVGEPVRLIEAELDVPANRHAPIAARLAMATASGAPIAAEFDFRQTGPQTWDIAVNGSDADQSLCLGHGGNVLSVNGVAQPTSPEAEYPAMYRHFADLVATGRSDVDTAPLQLVADAFLRGRSCVTEAFKD
jgi:D-galactose 1-dehydrogenase